MSRSHRSTPVTGITTARSEKQDKRLANRAERRTCKGTLRSNPETEILPHRREISNVWSFDKDGKQRFDPQEHPRLMRK